MKIISKKKIKKGMKKSKLNESQQRWNKSVEEKYKADELLNKNKKDEKIITSTPVTHPVISIPTIHSIPPAKYNDVDKMITKEIKKNEKKNLKDKAKENEKGKKKDDNTEYQKEFEELKKQFYEIDTDETLKKWKILSKAYELGKKMHGSTYSIFKLSKDFKFPYTTTKRILSLNRATKQTWDLINEGKITAFRAAQICMTKNHDYQDETVEMVIKEKLSTVQIKKLRIDNRGDIKEARLTTALENGFARKDTAYKSLNDTLYRLNRLLNIKKDDLPQIKIDELIVLMKNTKKRLSNKINELEFNVFSSNKKLINGENEENVEDE
jgi:hypothetical protein